MKENRAIPWKAIVASVLLMLFIGGSSCSRYRDYCLTHPTDERCSDYCKEHPDDADCKDYCDAHPTDARCATPPIPPVVDPDYATEDPVCE
jgi:hypothetical protein